MSESTSYLKYLKYKAKYLQLKHELEGGAMTENETRLHNLWVSINGNTARKGTSGPTLINHLKTATAKGADHAKAGGIPKFAAALNGADTSIFNGDFQTSSSGAFLTKYK